MSHLLATVELRAESGGYSMTITPDHGLTIEDARAMLAEALGLEPDDEPEARSQPWGWGRE